MSQLDDEVTVVITNKPDSELYAVFEESNFDVNVGESGALQVSEGIQYIQSGKKEIGEAVAEVKAEITAHATQKTAEFDENAEQKTNNFNANATAKTQAFNTNATEKTNTFNQNASSLTADFNNNANARTNVFNQNATDKTNAYNTNASNKTATFNTNASNKTTDFNNNYTEKKALIDAEVQTAETAATNASNSAIDASNSADDALNYSAVAKQWAIGDPSEPTGYSSKYWAEQSEAAAATVGNGKIIIEQGGVQKGMFTVNQQGNTLISLDAGSSGGVTMTYNAQKKVLTWS